MEAFWLFLTIVIVTRSQVGRAIADWIGGQSGPQYSQADLEAAERRLEERLLELEERMEFAERLLQRKRTSDGLPPID